MSWNFYGIGKPAALVAKAQKDLTSYKCVEPEETIKTKFLDILGTALDAYPDNSVVTIKASGSQMTSEGKFINTLSIDIQNVYGFVE